MARKFTHDFATDFIAFDPGDTAALDGGPITMAVLWKADLNKDGGLMVGRNASNATVWGLNNATDTHVYASMAAGFRQLDTWALDTWYLTAVTKANGSSAVRAHTYDYTGGTWTHTDYAALADATNGPVTELRIGWYDSSDRLDGKIAAAAVWASALTDGQLEGLTAAMDDWLALSPAWAVQLNQASTSDTVTDLTGGGGDQTSISGTAVAADDPPGWSYSVGLPSAAPDGIAVPVGLGDPAAALLGATPDGIALPVALSQPETPQLGVAPSGVAVPVALGDPAAALLGAFPDGAAVPAGAGTPAVSLLGATPDGIDIPAAAGTPTAALIGVAPTGLRVPVHAGSPRTDESRDLTATAALRARRWAGILSRRRWAAGPPRR